MAPLSLEDPIGAPLSLSLLDPLIRIEDFFFSFFPFFEKSTSHLRLIPLLKGNFSPPPLVHHFLLYLRRKRKTPRENSSGFLNFPLPPMKSGREPSFSVLLLHP